MKLKIIKKTIREDDSPRTGKHYKISSLYVAFQDVEKYNNIVKFLKSEGKTIEQIDKICKIGEYDNAPSYTFSLNCSTFTFEKVERFGILDASVIFPTNERGFVNPQIQVIDRKEQIHEYEPPERMMQEEVEGWANSSAEPSQKSEPEKSSLETESSKIVGSYTKPIDDYTHSDDLPF